MRLSSGLNRFLLFLLINFLSFLIIIPDVLAQSNNTTSQCPANAIYNPLDPNCDRNLNLGIIFNVILNVVPFIVVLIAVGFFAWGAIKIIIAGEDSNAREKGIETMRNAIIGLVAFFLIGMILWIVSLVTGSDIASFILGN
ncbi:MAG: pilin [Candidatus Dojkabacteria bacterium]|nr:pilin [Candidatus Dojkabacteria bacterium]